jgi:parvulin-like peptidyl-prolyl isomerase
MLIALLAAGSLLVQPLHLSAERPPLASARRVLLAHGDAAGRTREEAVALARDLASRVREGADFGQLAARLSAGPEAQSGGELGTFVPGVLAPALDEFLFRARDGEVSAPIPLSEGVVLLQRVETRAAVLRIQVTGDAARRAQRAQLVERRLAAGEDFAAVARELSDDRDSAARGGQFAVYERGANDVLLKRAAFGARVGEVVGPIDVPPLGLNWIQRVPVDAVDPRLAEDQFVRLSAILFQFDTALGADPATAPNEITAKGAADRAQKRLDAGEDFRALARELTDDPGGRERGGDLGWVHRGTPGLSDPVRQAFLLAPGARTPVLRSSAGWVIVRRDR